MELLWAIFLIVVIACLYTGYRFGRWKERRHNAKVWGKAPRAKAERIEVHP